MNNPQFNINPNNPMFNAFGGYQNFMSQLNAYAQQFQQAQQSPDQLRAQAQSMMNNGQMSQQTFEQVRQMTNTITGMNL